MTIRAAFRPASQRPAESRFVVAHMPPGIPRGVVVAVHPFAEEMNKSRRMVTLAARAMAGAGLMVVTVDLRGCGDSDGDLETASWADWIDDVLDTVRWARQECGVEDLPLWLWGLRAGCLVAVQACERLQGDCHLLMWQPQLLGKHTLQQFLRLKMAGQLQQGGSKGMTESLVQELASGGVVEVAGYRLGRGIADGLSAAQCGSAPQAMPTSMAWFEVSSQTPPALLPASQAAIERWRSAGCAVTATVVQGPLFWQSLGIEEAPELVSPSIEVILSTIGEVTA